MSTSKSQRVGIWIITIVTIVGVIASFAAMGLTAKNQEADSQALQEAYNQYLEDVETLSNKYYDEFSKYASEVSPFEASSVTELKKTDLKVGSGQEITSTTDYYAYYIGWNPSGVIFDQSISDGSLKDPISGSGLIQGWSQGVIGMKIGGVRELSIPSELAYGSTGSGENIPANTPIKFVVMAVSADEVPNLQDYLSAYY